MFFLVSVILIISVIDLNSCHFLYRFLVFFSVLIFFSLFCVLFVNLKSTDGGKV